MFEYILGENAWLSSLKMQDARHVFELIEANREYLSRWFDWVDRNRSIDDIKKFLRKTLILMECEEAFIVGIYFNNNLCGIIGFHYIDWHNRRTSIGYWLAETFQGKGLVTRSVRALTTYAFSDLKLHRIEIAVAVDNMRSRAIPERLGFKLEGVRRGNELIQNHFVDNVIYSILAPEWVEKLR